MLAIAPSSRQTSYKYFDAEFKECWFTSVPQSDDQAIEHMFSHSLTMMGACYVARVTAWVDGKAQIKMLNWVRVGEELALNGTELGFVDSTPQVYRSLGA